jgi:dUTP pyrophosphatase
VSIVYEPLYPDVKLPAYATDLSAGMDAHAYLMGRELTIYHPQGLQAGSETQEASIRIQMDGLSTLLLWPGWRVAIPLGFKAQLPAGWEMQVRSRSGLTLKQGLVVANAPGTIDADYPGEWAVILQNTGRGKVHVAHGDRIAQLVLAPVHRLAWTMGVVGQTTDRAGGFGSTGV